VWRTSSTRLAAGETDFAEAEPGEKGNEPEQLGVREQFRWPPERHVFRHAVNATEVADVRQGNPQVVDVALILIEGHGGVGSVVVAVNRVVDPVHGAGGGGRTGKKPAECMSQGVGWLLVGRTLSGSRYIHPGLAQRIFLPVKAALPSQV